MPVITTTNVLSTTEVIALTGPTKIVAEDMVAADEVIIYEETGTTGNYQKLPSYNYSNRRTSLTADIPSIIFEGYGNYKFLLGAGTATDLVVSYVAG